MTDELIKRAEEALTCMIPPFAKDIIQDLLTALKGKGYITLENETDYEIKFSVIDNGFVIQEVTSPKARKNEN